MPSYAFLKCGSWLAGLLQSFDFADNYGSDAAFYSWLATAETNTKGGEVSRVQG